jgi:hypothetical protein
MQEDTLRRHPSKSVYRFGKAESYSLKSKAPSKGEKPLPLFFLHHLERAAHRVAGLRRTAAAARRRALSVTHSDGAGYYASVKDGASRRSRYVPAPVSG